MPILFLAFLLSAGVLQAGTRARDARAVAAAKKTSVHRIDASLPDRPLEKWLREAVGPRARLTLEVNDCGEQTGKTETDKGRDFPLCTEAQVVLPESVNSLPSSAWAPSGPESTPTRSGSPMQ